MSYVLEAGAVLGAVLLQRSSRTARCEFLVNMDTGSPLGRFDLVKSGKRSGSIGSKLDCISPPRYSSLPI
jgi:hypothetical protein